MVPTFTCGLLRSNFSLAMSSTPSSLSTSTFARRARWTTVVSADLARRPKPGERAKDGADVQNRTGDLVLTKDALCQLSYIGLRPVGFGQAVARREAVSRGGRRLERETGIEPATNSLEGCDSTTELLPPTR